MTQFIINTLKKFGAPQWVFDHVEMGHEVIYRSGIDRKFDPPVAHTWSCECGKTE